MNISSISQASFRGISSSFHASNGRGKIGAARPDSFVNSREKDTKADKKTDKKSLYKKIAIFAASAGLIAAGAIALLRLKNLSKLKKEITAVYDTVFADMQKEKTGFDFNFEKPELIFKRLEKGVQGLYKSDTNQIVVDPRKITNMCILKDLKKADFVKLSDGTKIFASCQDAVKNGKADLYRVLTKKEADAAAGSVFAHELMHAKQFQLLLSSEGGAEKYINAVKRNAARKGVKLSENELKELFPFVFSYKPKTKVSFEKSLFREKIPEAGYYLRYSPKDVLDAFTHYTSGDDLAYYRNLTEISARNSEYRYWRKLLSKSISSPDNGLSRDFIEYNAALTGNTVQNMIHSNQKAA